MRKVVIEIPRSYLGDLKGSELIESLKILQSFRSDAGVYSGVCKLKLRGSGEAKLTTLVGTFGITKIEPLSRDEDGSYIAYVEGKPMSHWMLENAPGQGYNYPPFELTPKAWRKTFLGSAKQIRRLLVDAEKSGLRFRVVYAGEAQFRPRSLISSLTENQKRALSAAYRVGYFDFPRRAGSDSLAKTLGLSKSTVSEHLRKAEKAILDQVLAD